MAEVSLFWQTNGTGDGTSTGYTQAQLTDLFRRLFLTANTSQGVLKGYGNDLDVTAGTDQAIVNTGAAIVYGFPYENTASNTLSITRPSVGTTGGHVVLRVNWAAQTVRLVAVRNSDGVNGTPALTQTANTTWEIRLASFTITTGGLVTITDTRAYTHPNMMVATANIDDSGVTTAKIADNNVTTAKIADANVTADKLASDAVTNVKIANDAVNTSELVDGAVTANKLASDAVTTVKILNSNVTTGKIADSNVTTAKIADGNVTTDKLASDAVDYTKVGNRVPQAYARSGGNASNWHTPGTTTYTPTAVWQQYGSIDVSISAGQKSGTVLVSFPYGFSAVPIVIATPYKSSAWATADEIATAGVESATVNGFYCWATRANPGDTSGSQTVTVHWVAVGPE